MGQSRAAWRDSRKSSIKTSGIVRLNQIPMSPAAVGTRERVRLFDATIVKKAVMAVTGVVLFAFVVGHLLGNLQVFLGPERINAYAAFLRGNIELLWGVRILLLVCVIAHIVVTIQLAALKSKARPIGYVKKKNSHSSVASRSMYYSGPMIAAFVVYHLLHMTAGVVHPDFQEGQVYANLVYGFQQIPVSVAYIVAIAFLCLHLNHGIYSMFQTLGAAHPKYMPRIRKTAAAISILLFLGYISIPLSVIAGIIHL
jgi:succinate dehydrogenase / fumarate reductase cytochrome b subunit